MRRQARAHASPQQPRRAVVHASWYMPAGQPSACPSPPASAAGPALTLPPPPSVLLRLEARRGSSESDRVLRRFPSFFSPPPSRSFLAGLAEAAACVSQGQRRGCRGWRSGHVAVGNGGWGGGTLYRQPICCIHLLPTS